MDNRCIKNKFKKIYAASVREQVKERGNKFAVLYPDGRALCYAATEEEAKKNIILYSYILNFDVVIVPL